MRSGKRSSGRTAGISKRKRAKGYVYEVRYRADESGFVKQRARTFATEDEAKAFQASMKHAIQMGDYIDPALASKTWKQVAEEWTAQKVASGKKARTLRGYEHNLVKWCSRWDDRAISSVSFADVQGLINEMVDAGRKPQTVRNIFNLVRGVLDYAVDAGYIRLNPALRLRRHLPKGEPTEQHFLTADQVATLAAALPAPYDLLVRLAAWSGLRAGELAGLRVNRVDVLRGRVSVVETVVVLKTGLTPDTPKSAKSRRTVPIPPALARQVADHVAQNRLGPDDYVFGGVDGSPLNHDQFYRDQFLPAVASTGLAPLRFHDLRHTYASLMHAQGRSMLEVSRWMGHSTYRLTADTYSHLWDDEDGTLGESLDAAFASARPASDLVGIRQIG